jgi:hypothetical protein
MNPSAALDPHRAVPLPNIGHGHVDLIRYERYARVISPLCLTVVSSPQLKMARDKETCVPTTPVRAALHARIKALSDILLRTHYYEEANWLWMAAASGECRQSTRAREILESTARIARQLGFPDVAKWIDTEVLAELN